MNRIILIVGTLTLYEDDGYPYVVPISYVYADGKIVHPPVQRFATLLGRIASTRSVKQLNFAAMTEAQEPLIRFGTPEKLPGNASPVQKLLPQQGARLSSPLPRHTLHQSGGIDELLSLCDDQGDFSRPVLFIAGENAHSRYFSEDAYKQANEPKELYIVPGANHVDLYDQTDKISFDKLTDFFKTNLK